MASASSKNAPAQTGSNASDQLHLMGRTETAPRFNQVDFTLGKNRQAIGVVNPVLIEEDPIKLVAFLKDGIGKGKGGKAGLGGMGRTQNNQ